MTPPEVVTSLVPVHIGQPEPGSEQDQVLRAEPERRAGQYGRPRPSRISASVDWNKHGLQPRWLGMETSDCAVALEPSTFHGRGADELDRFLTGARKRGELALIVAVIGNNDDHARGIRSVFDSSISVSKMFTSISGRRLPAQARPRIAPGLNAADRDLAIRLLTRPADAPWWNLQLRGAYLERGDGAGSEIHEAEGQLHPILVDALDNPVVAAWTPPTDDQRWYIIPDATDWDSVLDWLMQRALVQYVPGALRRARSPHFADPDLQTAGELAARRALEELEARYVEEKLRLELDLREARAQAEPTRYGLLYGTGAQLVRAVAEVLTAAGLYTVDLDEALGATRSADLLVSSEGQQRRLIEVKAAGGAAQENLVGHLQRHLDTWPQLRPDEPVTGGVLIVNHQHKLHPSERSAHVYSRPEFVAALRVIVVSSMDLFRWWRVSDWAAIRAAVLGADSSPPPSASLPTEATSDPPPSPSRTRRWWPSGRAK